MSLSKNGLLIDCEQCKFKASGENNDFIVIVPISDVDEDKAGSATLKCIVSVDHHLINLQSFVDSSGKQIQISKNSQKRLEDALKFVGAKKVCGNRNICPANVVNFVEKINKS